MAATAVIVIVFVFIGGVVFSPEAIHSAYTSWRNFILGIENYKQIESGTPTLKWEDTHPILLQQSQTGLEELKISTNSEEDTLERLLYIIVDAIKNKKP